MSESTFRAVDLNILPNFVGVSSPADIEKRFVSSAQSIMNSHCLEINGQEFCVTALELYLKLHNQKSLWWDVATDKDHDANEQFNRGTWYVRRKKGQRYWRIDITAGNAGEDIQAGILIRQLDGNGGPSPGPATALHRIVRGKFSDERFNQAQLDLLDKIHGRQIDGSDGSPLVLKRRSSSTTQNLAKGKRFNLPRSVEERFRVADLRVSVWREYSTDELIGDDMIRAV